MSEERGRQIAALLKNGLVEEDARAMRYKRLLSILGQLNDVEVIVLQSNSREAQHDEAFWEKHAALLDPKGVHFGSSQQELDEATLREASLAQLERLRLLRPLYRAPRRGETPDFNEKTGTIKATGYEVTRLGRLLLRAIEVVPVVA